MVADCFHPLRRKRINAAAAVRAADEPNSKPNAMVVCN